MTAYCMGTTHGGKYPCGAKARVGGYCLQHHPNRAEANRELKARAKKRRFFTALTDPGFGLSVEAAVKNFGVLVAVDAVTVIDISDAVYGQEPKPVRFSTATHAQLYYPGARSELLQLLNESMEIIA